MSMNKNITCWRKKGINQDGWWPVATHKKLEEDVWLKRKNASTMKKELKLIREGKKELEFTVQCNIENILQQKGITAAEYHGGALNGVMSHRLMAWSKNVSRNWRIHGKHTACWQMLWVWNKSHVQEIFRVICYTWCSIIKIIIETWRAYGRRLWNNEKVAFVSWKVMAICWALIYPKGS